MDKYTKIINDINVYPSAIVQRFGRDDPRWLNESPKQQEESLRHDYTCLLLTNTKLKEGISEMELALTMSGFQESSSSSSKYGSNMQFEEGEMDTDKLMREAEGYNIEVASDNDDDEVEFVGDDDADFSTDVLLLKDDEDDDLFRMDDPDDEEAAMFNEAIKLKEGDKMPTTDKYRYILLEGNPSAALLQTTHLLNWGCVSKCSCLFDIIDTQEKKLIEVKVSSIRLVEHVQKIRKDTDIPEMFWGVAVVKPSGEGGFTYHNMTAMPGEIMATNFLAQRQIAFSELSTMDTDLPDDSEFFKNRRFNKGFHDWFNRMCINEQDVAPNINIPEFPKEVGLTQLATKLEDLNLRGQTLQPALWRGKIFPFGVATPIETQKDLDHEIITDFFDNLELEMVSSHYMKSQEKEEMLFNSVMEFMNLINGCTTNFNYASVKKKKNGVYTIVSNKDNKCPNLLEALGIGAKRRRFNADCTGMKQPDYWPIEKTRFVDFITDIVEEQRKTSDYVALSNLKVTEAQSDHKMDQVACDLVRFLFNRFKMTKAGITTATYMNLMSRLGGSYLITLTGTKKTTHSSIAGMPIYATVAKEGKTTRLNTGVLIRGPHHVKNSTDKISFITIEIVDKDWEVLNYTKGLLCKDKKGKFYFIRQNSIRRADPSFGAFLSNLLFVPANFMGEVFFSTPTLGTTDNNFDKQKRAIFQRGSFFMERCVEVMFMGLLGGSQEEGYFPIYRMLYMTIMAWSRGECVYCHDFTGLIEKMNECLINSAWVLWLHKEFHNFVKYLEKNKFSVLR